MMTEDKYMPLVRESWAYRCANLNLRPGTKARERELLAFLQGVLAVATATGVMTMDRANMIALLSMVGRGEEYLAIKEKAAAE